MTVMFVDLVGSTAMAEQHEPEVVRDVLRDYQARCAQAIAAHGGHIFQYVGDGILVYFGFPVAREDDARQAVQAGLDIVGSLAQIAAGIKREHGIEIAARVGVHTGVVLVSDMGSEAAPERDAVIGPAPNQAARIQSLAPENAVVISDDTLEIVQGYFEVESLGTPAMKGIDRVVEVFRVLGPTGAQHRLEVPERVQTPFVGRATERRALREIWEALVEAPPSPTRIRTVMVRGEAGIGKSRLADWLTSEALAVGNRVLTGLCAPDRQASRLFPVSAMLERQLEFQGDDDLAARIEKCEVFCDDLGLNVRTTMPFLLDVLGVPAADRFPLPALDPRLLRERTFDALADIVRAHARSGRTLVVLEDVQWADESTLSWLARLTDLESTLPFLLLMTARAEFEPWTGPNCASFDLGPLTGADQDEFVQALAQVHGVPEARWTTIATRSDGNPLFAEELAKAIAKRTDGDRATDAIPMTIRDLLTARLDALGEEKQLAQAAAVIGREFDVDLLRSVCGLNRKQLAAGLAALVRAGVVEERADAQPPVSHQFVHALVRDAAYESQESRQARATHLRVAETLRDRGGADPGLIAQHFDAAAVADDAVSWYLLAGIAAQTAAADAEAIRYLDRSLELLPSLADGPARDFQEFNLRIVRATSHVNRHGYSSPGAAADFGRSLELSEQVATGVDIVPPTAAIWAYYLVHGDLRSAAGAIERLHALAGTDLEPEILCCTGVQRFFEGRIVEAREILESSVERFGDRDPEERTSRRWLLPNDAFCVALTHLGFVLWMVGEADAAESRLDQAMRRAASLPSYPRGAFTEAYVASYAALVEIQAARYERSRELHERTVAVAQRYGMQFWISSATAGRAIASAHLGEPEAALEMLALAMEQWRNLGAGALMPYDLMERALMHVQLGELERARADIDDALASAESTTEHLFTAETHRVRAAILRVIDADDPQVRAELLTARRLAAEQGSLVFELRAALDLVELAGTTSSDDVDALRDVVGRLPTGADLPEFARLDALMLP